MPKVDILVSNRNSLEAIQLCVESVHAYTRPGDYQLIVYDDVSDNGIDIPYLRGKQEQGWLRLIEGERRVEHGGALNALVNVTCESDLAVIMDCDIEVLRDGWLDDFVELLADDPLAIAAVRCHGVQVRGGTSRGGAYLAPFCEWWFGLLNMQAYRDDMQVDWTGSWVSTKEEFMALPDAASLPIDKMATYSFDVGCKFYDKVLHNNPKGYYIVSPLPGHINNSFNHYLQVCHHIADGRPEITAHVRKKLDVMRQQLKGLRHG
jgi:glycosyltransferase involved in cell wall biosynthesis